MKHRIVRSASALLILSLLLTTPHALPASAKQPTADDRVALYQALLGSLRAGRVHRAIGCISLPNAASIGLHEKLGFRKVGQFTEVGWKFDRWIDVGYWELML